MTDRSPLSTTRTFVLTIGLVTAILVSAVSISSIWTMHGEASSDAERNLRTTARVLAEHTTRQFASAKSLLENVHAGQGFTRTSAKEQSVLDGGTVHAAGVVDRSGKVSATALNAGERPAICPPKDMVQVHEKLAASVHMVSAGQCPNGSRHLFLSQRIEGPGGEFSGVAFVSLRAEFLNDYFHKLGFDGRTSVSIYTRDLHPLAAWPGTSAFAPLQKLRLLKLLDDSQGVISDTPGQNANSGKAIIALANVDGTPIVIGAEITSDHYLAQWWRLSIGLLLVAACGILGLVGTVILLFQMMRRHRIALTDLEVHKALKRQAEDENRSKSEYLAIMSHEIRTSMSGVLGMAEFMLRSKLYKEQHSGVRVLYDAGQNLVQIINKILDFSKIESGTLELAAAPFEPTDLVDRVADLFAKEALNKGITLDRVKPGFPLWVLGDDLRIRQILSNFVGNALKFTKTGGVSIILDVRTVVENGAHVRLRFEVRDSGIGIPVGLQSRLFQPFHQVDTGIAREFGGTGLGLSICKRLSDLMGGRIWLESKEGKGSRFFFEIECARAVAVTQDSVPVQMAPDEGQSEARTSILLVEDNVSNLKIATMYLERDGYRVTGALDGAEAIEKFRNGHYDIILMDGAMPRMDGYEATRRIRMIESDEKRHRVPIIATTANTGPENEQKCIDAGMDDFVPKPYRFSDLKVKIARWSPAN